MCGIVGYVGDGQALDVLLGGLRRLEYRGYDSAGIALGGEEGTLIYRAPGRVQALADRIAREGGDRRETVGIAHTRWATHGAPTEANAHPHRAGRVTLVHNGIVENAHERKESLCAAGCVFLSETDTEVIVQAISALYESGEGGELGALAAIDAALASLRGSWALTILFDDQPGVIYAARQDSPLYVGTGEGGCAAASDLSAFPEGIGSYLIPEPGEVVRMTREGVRVYRAGVEVTGEKATLPCPVRTADEGLGDYPHFMRKEIAEEPRVLGGLIERYFGKAASEIFARELPDLSFLRAIHLVGCGSAMHAGMLGCCFLESLTRIPVRVHVASEFRYADPILYDDELVIVISQSGETADSLAALRLAKQRGIATLAIVNVPGSTMTREADYVILTHAGPEIAVATTKAFSAQVTLLYLLALRIAADRGTLSDRALEERRNALARLEAVCQSTFGLFNRLEDLASKHKDAEHCFFIGRGRDYALSMEGALKLKEISYIHCEAYPAGELKHGTISLITRGVPCLVCATDRALYEKTLSGAKEVKARGASVIMLVGEDALVPPDLAYAVIRIPTILDELMPLPSVIALQYFAYCTALARGCDVDKPRNLAKSVTVE